MNKVDIIDKIYMDERTYKKVYWWFVLGIILLYAPIITTKQSIFLIGYQKKNVQVNDKKCIRLVEYVRVHIV